MSIYQKSAPPDGYYVYAYLRKDGSPYYIGKGIKKRAWSPQHTVSPPVDSSMITIVEANLSEIGAFALERRLIAWYGRKNIGTGILRNSTAGGEGTSAGDRSGPLNPMFGRKHSNTTNLKISSKLKGIKKNNEPLFLQIKLENDFIVNKKIIF